MALSPRVRHFAVVRACIARLCRCDMLPPEAAAEREYLPAKANCASTSIHRAKFTTSSFCARVLRCSIHRMTRQRATAFRCSSVLLIPPFRKKARPDEPRAAAGGTNSRHYICTGETIPEFLSRRRAGMHSLRLKCLSADSSFSQ